MIGDNVFDLVKRTVPEFVKRIAGLLVGHTENSWERVVMNRETLEWVKALETEKMTALEISGKIWDGRVPFKSYKSIWYPEYDVCEKPLAESYDIIIAEQVFEHLLYPSRAARHVFEMLRGGGYFLLTTPFLYRIHAYPNDCSRWTPQGMAYFLEEAGFPLDKVRVGAWGNRACVTASFRGRCYCSRIHTLENEPAFPVVVWALAQK